MADSIGIFSILLIVFITTIFALKWRDVTEILFVALGLRVFFLLVGYYVSPLPDSSGDANSFEYQAWLWSEEGFYEVLDFYPGPSSSFISWIIAILYSLIFCLILSNIATQVLMSLFGKIIIKELMELLGTLKMLVITLLIMKLKELTFSLPFNGSLLMM